MYNNSFWIDSTKSKKVEFDFLSKDLEVDVCIIGGGITGISTAYYLAKQGKKVCVLEKDKIGNHTTGNTTGKITYAHDLFYDYLINSFSSDFAKGYLDANIEAIENIKKIIDEEKIDCDFSYKDNYIFTDEESETKKLKDEVLALKSLGMDVEYLEKIDIPAKSIGAIKYKNQAQFHSLKYIYGLCNCLKNYDCNIYENSKVYDVKKESDKYATYTKDYKVFSDYVVIASHYPIINAPRILFFKNVSRIFIYYWV